MFKNWSYLLILLSILCSVNLSIAQDNDEKLERIWDFGIGVGYGNSSNPYVGADDVPNYLTMDFSIYGERFFFDNGELGFTVIEKENFGVNIISTYNSERIFYSYLNDLGIRVFNTGSQLIAQSDSPIVNIEENTIVTAVTPGIGALDVLPRGDLTLAFEIPDRDLSINVGAEIIYNNDYGTFRYQFSKDVIAVHSGMDMIVDYNKSWSYKKWGLSTNLGFHWKSSKLVDYYYGVNTNQDALIDFEYKASSSIDTLMGVKINYRINNNLFLVASYQYNRFGASIRNSPIINKKGRQVIFTGLVYRF